MAAKKTIQKAGSKPNKKQLEEIRKVLAKHFKTNKGKIDVSSCVRRKSGTWTVGASVAGVQSDPDLANNDGGEVTITAQ